MHIFIYDIKDTTMIKLKKLLLEQTTTAAAPAPAAAPATDKFGIPGFTAPALGAQNSEFGPDAESPATPWLNAYEKYLDNASGWVGKTVVVFKRGMLYPDEIVERFVVQSSFAYTGIGEAGQKPVRFWSTKQATRNFDTATKKLLLRKGMKAEAEAEDGDYLLGTQGVGQPLNYVQMNANIAAQPVWEPHPNYPGSSAQISWNVSTGPDSLKITGADYSIDWTGKVTKAGQVIGYCPVSPYNAIPSKPEGYGTVMTAGDEIPLQNEAWRDSFNEPAEDTKKKKK
jgi:hypothetical protein